MIEIAREELERKYVQEGKSMKAIGEIIGCTTSTIFHRLHDYQIRTRPRYLPNTNEISSRASAFLEGELMGDGSLIPLKSGNCYFAWHMKYLEYVEWLSIQLNLLNIKTRAIVSHLSKSPIFKNPYYTYLLRSNTYTQFKEIRARWYPQGKKILPKDLQLTPLGVRQWYLGDGNLWKDPDSDGYALRFATQSFSVKENDELIDKFREIGIEATQQKGPIIYIRTKSLPRFFEYIGPHPKELNGIYSYKWDYPTQQNAVNDNANLDSLLHLN